MVTPTPVGALGPGDHACLTFSDSEERLDVVAAFVRDGLSGGQKVICFTESIPGTELAWELAERQVPTAGPASSGQLSVRDSVELWRAEGDGTAADMIDLLARELEVASEQGYPGLRVTADMCWAARPLSAVDQLVAFETGASQLFADGRLTAICQYDRQSFDPVTLAFVARTHPYALAAAVYHEDPVLRVCRQYSPGGIRLAGEIDFSRLAVLEQALSESLRLDRCPWLNLRHLRFLDAAVAAAIVRAADSLTGERVMTVVGGRLVTRMLDLVGGSTVPQLRVRIPGVRP